ncbi:MAG: glycoside hydrolase family 31 protein [Bacteroidales bacterium]
MKNNKYLLLLLLFVVQPFFILAQQSVREVVLTIPQGEYWWTGITSRGHEMPYDMNSTTSIDMWGDNQGNQAQPLLLSNTGRYIWSESPIKYQFDKGKLVVTVREGEVLSGKVGDNLKSAFEYVSNRFFPSNGMIPDEMLFTHPQYNTWIELMYNQNEEDILKYARDIVKNGFTPGVIMIDDNWQEDYGSWTFSAKRFKDPKGMIKELHEMGFKVMVWICPFVSADSEVYRKLAADRLLLLDKDLHQDILWANTSNKPAIVRWWNGASACVDLSNPKAQEWFKGQLDILVNEYKVDGFKFDAGDAESYTNDVVSYDSPTPNDQTSYFAKLGLNYPLNEYRASWKMAGLPLAQRLRDKTHRWGDLEKLIPDQMSQSVAGYAYTCPDMIGGGEYQSFLNGAVIDQELIVRSAQVHALMPMMQFSVAPWRVLSKENTDICLKMAKIHEEFASTFITLAKESSVTGMPIVKPMELAFPGKGYEQIKDQFVLGDNIVVAPVVKKGDRSRKVTLPEGRWVDELGKKYKGGKTIDIPVPLDRLPYFSKY